MVELGIVGWNEVGWQVPLCWQGLGEGKRAGEGSREALNVVKAHGNPESEELSNLLAIHSTCSMAGIYGDFKTTKKRL